MPPRYLELLSIRPIDPVQVSPVFCRATKRGEPVINIVTIASCTPAITTDDLKTVVKVHFPQVKDTLKARLSRIINQWIDPGYIGTGKRILNLNPAQFTAVGGLV